MKKKRESTPISFKNSALTIVVFIILDIIFAAVSFCISRSIMFHKFDEPPRYEDLELAIAVGTVLVTSLLLFAFGCYKVIWKYAGLVELFRFILAYLVTAGVLFLSVLIFRMNDIEVWSPIILMYLLFSALFSGTIRFSTGILHYFIYIKTKILKKVPDGAKRTVVIGAGYTGSLIVNRFINNLHEGYYPVAIVDDDVEKQGKKLYGVKVVGGIDVLDRVVALYNPQVFVIAIMSLTKSKLRDIYNACSVYKIPVKVAPYVTDATNEINSGAISLRNIKIENLLGRDEFKVKKELIDASIRDKTVMVTGGAGSIGSELCRQVLKYGCKHLIIFDQHENGMFYLNDELLRCFDASRFTLVVGTVREYDKLSKVFDKYRPDVVFHAAAYKHVPMMEISATEAIKNNVFGTLNVINCVEKYDVEAFVLISTDKAVNPSNIMGASKRIAEMLIETRGKNSKTRMAAVRFGNVLGSNGSVIPTFLSQIESGGPITLTDRNIKRYFMSIPEAVRLVLQTGAFAKFGEIFVLDMGEPVYIYDLACDLIKMNGLVPEKDIKINIVGLRPGEKMFEELRYDNEAVNSTLHEGVFVNIMEDINKTEFDKNLDKLLKYAFLEDNKATADQIFKMVPNKYRNPQE